MPRPQKSLVGFELRLVRAPGQWLSHQLYLQRAGNCCRDLILHREHVRHLAVIALGPEMIAILGVDKLRGHTNPAATPPHTAFQDCPDMERLRDLSDVLLLAAE